MSLSERKFFKCRGGSVAVPKRRSFKDRLIFCVTHVTVDYMWPQCRLQCVTSVLENRQIVLEKIIHLGTYRTSRILWLIVFNFKKILKIQVKCCLVFWQSGWLRILISLIRSLVNADQQETLPRVTGATNGASPRSHVYRTIRTYQPYSQHVSMRSLFEWRQNCPLHHILIWNHFYLYQSLF